VQIGAVRRACPLPALRHTAFRWFLVGQSVSLVGTWMHRVALPWLVLELTRSALLLGAVTALQAVPVILLSLAGGVLADRVPKRRILICTQAAQMTIALAIGVLVVTGTVRVWQLAVLIACFGLSTALDDPARHAFVAELVGREDVLNAVGLTSTIFNVARLIGPAFGAAVMTRLGIGWTFLVNAASFVPVLAALLLMRPPAPSLARSAASNLRDQLREGLTYVWGTPTVRRTLLLVGASALLLMNFSVLVPVFARTVLRVPAGAFSMLMAAQGAGAFAGALGVVLAGPRRPRGSVVTACAAVLAATELAMAVMRGYPMVAAGLAVGGAALVVLQAMANTTLQVSSPDYVRARVMAVYSLVLAGAPPIGAMLAGALAQTWGAPVAFLACGTVALLVVWVLTSPRVTLVLLTRT